MIIPYGHKGLRVRGLPWVTVSIFGLCVVVFLATAGASNRSAQESGELFSKIAELYLARPSLEFDPQLEDMLFLQFGIDENERDVFLRSLNESRAGQPVPTSGPTQRDLDSLTHRFWSAYRGSPHYQWGVVPDDISPVDLVTYQFLHGGWGHLIGNLLFLYLAAPHLEDRWGRSMFAVFYLLAGVVAALFWALRYPGLDVPLVGASGAIAGLMGAFLICFGTSKIRFFYWFFIIWGTFEAPAWLMLPMWLVMEVISGRTMDVLSQGDGGGGVAHWAHVWGFIFGMAFAGGLHILGIDAKLAADSTRLPSQSGGGLGVGEALMAARAGRIEESLELLKSSQDSETPNIDGTREIWKICVESGRAAEAEPVMLGAVRRAARQSDDHGVIDLWAAVMDGAPEITIDPVLALRIAEALERRDRLDLLAGTLAHADTTKTLDAPPQVMARLAKLREGLSADGVLPSNDPGDDDGHIAGPRAGETSVSAPPGAPSIPEVLEVWVDPGPAVEIRPRERLRILEGIPRAIDGPSLVFEVQNAKRSLDLSKIEAVAVGALMGEGQRPFLLIDLLLDPPSDGTIDLRVIRFRSSSFDPRSLVGGDQAMGAFVDLVQKLLSESDALSLPDEETVAQPSRRSYDSIEIYEQEVLGVMG